MYKVLLNMKQIKQSSPLLAKKGQNRHKCCRGYRFVWIRSKGALVALLFISMRGFEFFGPHTNSLIHSEVANVYNACICLAFPLLGLLSDVRFGRYKTLLALTLTRVLLSAIPLPLYLISHLLKESPSQAQNTDTVYSILWFVNKPIAIWFTIISFTFGLDQLLDAPSCELSVFIHWRLFGFASVNFINCALEMITESIATEWDIGYQFVYFLSQMICLMSLLAFHKFFDLQPQNTNPLNLIARVLHYALRNSRPRRRSAFTYWQEEKFSRLDMGKEKFGGPFTEEQVEDVKTFFRLVPLIIAAITLHGLANYNYMTYHLQEGKNTKFKSFIMSPLLYDSIFYAEYSILLLVHLCIVFPFYHRHHPSMLKKIGIGCFACVTAYAIYLVIETVGYMTSKQSIQCTYNYSMNPLQKHIPTLMYVLNVATLLKALVILFINPVLDEFCFAQTPHSMKSLTFAILVGCSEMISTISFKILPNLYATLLNAFPSCGFYYLLTLFLISALFFVIFCVIAKKYKLRVRQEIYHSHYVVENIFVDEFNRRDREEADNCDIYNAHTSNEELHCTY